MKQGETEQRRRARMRLELPVRVAVREGPQEEWTEVTRLQDLTPFGARFSLARLVDRGRLVHLTLPMPRQLRCFDHIEDQYRVWALVRRVTLAPPVAAAATGLPRFEVGVAFVGKRPPASFIADPTTRYQIAADPSETDLWPVREQQPAAGTTIERETRLSLPVEVVIEVLDEHGQVTASEQTVTENISRHGAAVFTTLTIERGRFVRVRSTRHTLTLLAVVRGCRPNAAGIPRLHLEFVDREWPLELIT